MQKAKKNLLELEAAMVLHVHTENFEVGVRFCVVNELAVAILFETSFIRHCVRGIFSFSRKGIWNTRPVYIRAMGRKSMKSTSAIATNESCTVTGNGVGTYALRDRR